MTMASDQQPAADPRRPVDSHPATAPPGQQSAQPQWQPATQHPLPAQRPAPTTAPPPVLGGAGPAPVAAAAAGAPAAAAAADRAAVAAGPDAVGQAGAASGRATLTKAAAGAEVAAAAGARRIRPRRIRPSTGPFTLGQLIYWQLAAAAVLAAYQHGPLAALVTAAVLVPLVAPTVIRLRGRWLHQWLSVWLRYRSRSRRLPAGGGNRAAELLRFVEPSVTVGTIEIGGRTVAAVSHRGGLCAVLELDPADGSLFVGPASRLPSPVSLLPSPDPGAPPVAVQLLVQVAAAPRASTNRGVVERSYRELTGGDVPAHRRGWLVIQVLRTVDGYADTTLRPVLASAVRRTRRQLKQDRVAARTLGPDDLFTAIGYLAQLPGQLDTGNLYGTAANRTVAHETWQAWWSGATPQICRRLLRWPQLPWQLDDVLSRLPMVSTVVSIAVAREPGHPAAPAGSGAVTVSAAVRLTAGDLATVTNGDQVLTNAVRESGGLTERIDGEHVHGLAVTLPLGGLLP
ncbi:type VII secretion protein EccE [Solwaraspora sp. WMMB335]|uniref:type VII secretion protein EccE n=1 Tax=Solwaraspora sp. WMMB335 TaxID=3404118 RepID=UPI003B944385